MEPSQGDQAMEDQKVDSGIVFDWIMVVLGFWFTVGLYLDIWAHIHKSVIETFFTPWHAVLYSGFLASAVFLYIAMIRNQIKGHDWRHAVPKGYDLSLLGVVIFLVGGVGDMFWHTSFGIEKGIEAVYSPTHLLLGLGGGLIGSGPIRASWYRSDKNRLIKWVHWFPTVLSFTGVVSLFTALSVSFHPLTNLWASQNSFRSMSGRLSEEMGVISIVLTAVILIVPILLLVRRWKPLPGTFTLLFSVNAIGMGFTYPEDYPVFSVIAIGVSGFVFDLMVHVLNPSISRVGQLRILAFLTPGVWTVLYFVSIQVTDGLSWSVHLWGGVVFISSIAGWLLSYLLIPPKIPSPQRVLIRDS